MLALLASLVATSIAQAQSYPDKTIRIITGTQTGTSGDLAGRLLAQKLTAQMGQPVVFESRPGANGQIAANYVKTLPPDGYSLLYVASSTVVTGPLMSSSVGFDTFKDFTPISNAVGAPLYLVANSELGVEHHGGACRLRQGQSGQAQLRQRRARLGVPLPGRGHEGRGRHRHAARALHRRKQRQHHRRSAGEPGAGLFPGVSGDACRAADRQDQAARRVLRRARQAATRSADREGGAAEPHHRAVVVRLHGVGRPAGADRQSACSRRWQRRSPIRSIAGKLEEVGIVPVGGTADAMANQLRRQIDELTRLAKQVGIEPN